MLDLPPKALGCMRLPNDEEDALAVLRAALDAGVTLLDTADAYGPSNERLVARAARGREVTVATKGGLTRPGGRWVPNGRARHLRAACEASLEALGVDRIDLYQLHAVDPKVPLATSVRALVQLQRDGLVKDIGLCNVNVGQLDAALEIAEIASVQVAISPFEDTSLRNGVARRCLDRGILLLAHSPFGGPKKAARLGRDRTLLAIAERHGCTPWEVALAWLRDLGLTPLPGPTRLETAVPRTPALTEQDREALDVRFPAGRILRVADRRPTAPHGDVVLIMGYPAAGKSTLAANYEARGYVRLNRDQRGGSVGALVPLLEKGLAQGERRFVLDNTYAGRASRNQVVEAAWRHGAPVRCEWLQTSLEDAQVNVVHRMIAQEGALPTPEQMAASKDPSVFPPRVHFTYRRNLEPPVEEEGFERIDRVPFQRRHRGTGAALFIDYEVLRYSLSGARAPIRPDDVGVHEDRVDRLRSFDRVIGLAWHPEVASGEATKADITACFERTHALLGITLETGWCPHPPGPPVCWCRKPLPGLAVTFVATGLDPSQCLLVGPSAQDRTLAERMGFSYAAPETFFG